MMNPKSFQEIDGTYDFHDPPCKYPSTINEGISAFNIDGFQDEDEVNSETTRANISEINQEVPAAPPSLAFVVIPPFETNTHRAAPICSSVAGPPSGITQEFLYLKAALQEAMTNYLQKCFRDVMKHGFSNIRSWWDENNVILQNMITSSFHANPSPLMKCMDVFLK